MVVNFQIYIIKMTLVENKTIFYGFIAGLKPSILKQIIVIRVKNIFIGNTEYASFMII